MKILLASPYSFLKGRGRRDDRFIILIMNYNLFIFFTSDNTFVVRKIWSNMLLILPFYENRVLVLLYLNYFRTTLRVIDQKKIYNHKKEVQEKHSI